MNARQRLRELLASPGIIQTVGVGDAGWAKLVEAAGFPVVFMSGALVSMTYGLWDDGLLTMTEMVERTRSITNVIEVPLIADADDGYGAPLQIMRTIREYENTGVAALHLEDMRTKKRGDLFPIDIMVKRIEAAVAARRDPNLVIIARTDAMRPTVGTADAPARVEDGLARSLAYAQAGADVIFVQTPQSAEVMRRFCKETPKPVMVTMGSHQFNEPADVLAEIGIKIVVFPMVLYMNTLPVLHKTLEDIRATGHRVYTAAERATDSAHRTLLGRDRFAQIQDTYGM